MMRVMCGPSGAAMMPAKIVWGWGATQALKDFIIGRGLKRVLFVTDPGIVEAGVLEIPLEIVKSAKAGIEVFDQVRPEPGIRTASAAINYGRQKKVDTVIGVGGGSSLDVAKLVAALVIHEKPIRDCLGMGNMPGKGLPLALIPTTTGTGSEVTQVSVLTDEDEGGIKKVAYDPALLADLVVVDPYLSLNLPPRVTAVTAVDALSHAIEAFVGNRRNPLTDAFAKEAILHLARYTRPAVLRGASCPEARYNMAIAATLAGLALSCGGAGATHALNYPLAEKYHLSHGESVARLLPYVMEVNFPSDPERYAVLARMMGVTLGVEGMGEMEQAKASVVYVKELCRDIGVETGIGDLVESEDDFEVWADTALRNSPHNIKNNVRMLSKEDIITVYRRAYKGG